MLIIAIPKSASTSLMSTLGKLHNYKSNQDMSFIKNPYPENSEILHLYHSDVRELTSTEVAIFNTHNSFFKQHIFPSPNNLKLLHSIKKVVLIRDSQSILMAYHRAMNKKIHYGIPEFIPGMDMTEWLSKAEEIGLLRDLNYFTETWKKTEDFENTILINYQELIDKPHKVINRIEIFFDLNPTKGKIKLAKKRYSKKTRLEIQYGQLLEKFYCYIDQSLKNKKNTFN